MGEQLCLLQQEVEAIAAILLLKIKTPKIVTDHENKYIIQQKQKRIFWKIESFP